MIERISERDVFRRLRADGVRGRSGPLTVVMGMLDETEHPAVAFALPRTVGSAVIRNRLRRQLKEAARQLTSERRLPPAAYLIIVHPRAKGSSMTTLRGHLDTAVSRAAESGRATQSDRASG